VLVHLDQFLREVVAAEQLRSDLVLLADDDICHLEHFPGADGDVVAVADRHSDHLELPLVGREGEGYLVDRKLLALLALLIGFDACHLLALLILHHPGVLFVPCGGFTAGEIIVGGEIVCCIGGVVSPLLFSIIHPFVLEGIGIMCCHCTGVSGVV
jgi:hypothetical protein